MAGPSRNDGSVMGGMVAIDTVLTQRAGATGEASPEKVTAVDQGKSFTDLEKDTVRIDAIGGVEAWLQRTKSVRDLGPCLIPETPSPKEKAVGRVGLSDPVQLPLGGASEDPPTGIFKGRGLTRTPPPSTPSGSGTKELAPKNPVVEGKDSSTSGADEVGEGLGVNPCERDGAAAVVTNSAAPPMQGVKATVVATQIGGGVPDGVSGLRLAEAVALLREVIGDCGKATREFTERKASSKVASVKWVIGFLGKVTRRCERAVATVTEVATAGEVSRWKEAPRKHTMERGTQSSPQMGRVMDTGGSIPQSTVPGGVVPRPPGAGVSKRSRDSPSPPQEANKKRALTEAGEGLPVGPGPPADRAGAGIPPPEGAAPLPPLEEVGTLLGSEMESEGPMAVVRSKGQIRRERKEARARDLQAQKLAAGPSMGQWGLGKGLPPHQWPLLRPTLASVQSQLWPQWPSPPQGA